MPGIRLAALVRKLRGNDTPDLGGRSDADLLARFAANRDEAAFELLVWRHGAMVLAACRRVLGHTEDAEDAFQAAFLVLARKAGSVRSTVPAWLHRVAVRIALKLARKRRPAAVLEIEPAARAGPDVAELGELRGVLDSVGRSCCVTSKGCRTRTPPGSSGARWGRSNPASRAPAKSSAPA
jgi:hypothetical protein